MHAMREITGQCVREAPTPGSLKASKGYGIGHDQEEAASFLWLAVVRVANHRTDHLPGGTQPIVRLVAKFRECLDTGEVQP